MITQLLTITIIIIVITVKILKKNILITRIVCLVHIILKTNLVWCIFLKVLCRGHRWVHGHLLWHKSHHGGSDSAWYCHFPAHLSWTRYNIGKNSLQHALKEGGGRSDQTINSTSNNGCSCTASTPPLPAYPGLDPSTEHVSEPQWLWMDIRCTWVWASSNSRSYGLWGSTEVHQLKLSWRLQKLAVHAGCCKKNGVMSISACGVCKGITCKNSSHDVVESEEDRQWLLKLLALGMRH